MKAIDQGIFTASTKDHLLSLESEKAILDAKISAAQAESGIAVTRESLTAYLEHFRGVDPENKNCQKELFDAFLKAVYLYDDHVTLIFDMNNDASQDIEINTDELEAD